MARNNKLKLSKHILEMKFMKKTKEKVESLEYQEEGEQYFENQLTDRMKKQSGNYIVEPSFIFCEGLIEGRFSFQGTNPEIERIMEIEKAQKEEKIDKTKETDVSDESMVKWNISMKHKIPETNRKNINDDSLNSEPNIKKRKFLKPSD